METTTPLPNDGMTAETAPGQDAENAETSNPTSSSAQAGTSRAQTFIDALHKLEKEGEAEAETNAAKLAELYSSDATLTNAALELTGKEAKGREAIAAFWREYRATLGEAYSEFSHVTESAEAAGLFWTTQSQDATKYHGATLLQFNGNEITFFRGYYDTRELEVEKK